MCGFIVVIVVVFFIDFIVLFGFNFSWGFKLVIIGILVIG